MKKAIKYPLYGFTANEPIHQERVGDDGTVDGVYELETYYRPCEAVVDYGDYLGFQCDAGGPDMVETRVPKAVLEELIQKGEVIESLGAEGINSGWLPIESAPKDGAKIDLLLHRRNKVRNEDLGYKRLVDCKWGVGYVGLDNDTGWVDSFGQYIEKTYTNKVVDVVITHWMPLPPAPEGGEA